MSTCISRHGEFGEHEFGEGVPEFTCRRCWVFDEEAALAEVEDLRAKVARVEALVFEFDSNIDWSSGRYNYGDNNAWEAAARQLRVALESTP